MCNKLVELLLEHLHSHSLCGALLMYSKSKIMSKLFPYPKWKCLNNSVQFRFPIGVMKNEETKSCKSFPRHHSFKCVSFTSQPLICSWGFLLHFMSWGDMYTYNALQGSDKFAFFNSLLFTYKMLRNIFQKL